MSLLHTGGPYVNTAKSVTCCRREESRNYKAELGYVWYPGLTGLLSLQANTSVLPNNFTQGVNAKIPDIKAAILSVSASGKPFQQ